MNEDLQFWVDRIQWPGLAAVVALVALGVSQNASVEVAEDPAGDIITASDRPPELIRGEYYFDSGDYATAVSCYNKVIEARPASAEALLNRAAALARLGDFQAAISDVTACVRTARTPEVVQAATLRLAEIHMLAKQNREAGYALDGFLADNTSAPHAWGLRAAQRMQQGNWRAAIRDHSQVIRLDRSSVDAFVNRALCYMRLEDFNNARADLERARALATKDTPAVIVNLCLIHLRHGEFPSVIALTTAAIDAGIAPAMMHRLRAGALTEVGRDDAAAVDLNFADSADPGPVDDMQPLPPVEELTELPGWQFSSRSYYVPRLAFHEGTADDDFSNGLPASAELSQEAHVSEAQLAALRTDALKLYADGDTDTAIACLSELLHHSHANNHARFLKTSMAIDAGDLAAALVDVNVLLKAKPDYATGLCLRGLIHARREQHDSAIHDFSDVIRLQPDGHEGYANRGAVYLTQGRYQQAVDDFQRAAERGADAAPNSSQLGRALAQCGRLEEALTSHDLAVVGDPTNPRALRDRALTYTEFGQLERAVDDYTAAIALAPNDAELLQLRAQVYATKEEFASALSDVVAAQRLAPTDASLQQTRRHLENLVSHQQMLTAVSEEERDSPRRPSR